MSQGHRRFTVAAAVIRDSEGDFLLTKRPQGTHMAGLWEFPGGKVEDGEDAPTALIRELREELAVEIEVGEPITFAIHRDPDLEILLLFFSAHITAGRLRPLEGQELAWVRPRDLGAYPMPPADARLVEQLSRLYSAP